MDNLLTVIPVISAVAAATWGIYVFNKQQKFKRLQNLSAILQRFGNNNEFIALFNLCDQSLSIDKQKKQIIYNEVYLNKLMDQPTENKLQYLVLLEEVALYARSFEIDRDYAVHLFRWHFYFIYNNPETSRAFWNNLGGADEINEPYWEYQKGFSKYCNPGKL